MITENINRLTQEVVAGGLELLGDKVNKIVLYGSYARGDYDSESDIDIMFLLNCSEQDVSKYRKIMCRLSSRIGLDYNIVVSLFLKDKDSYYDRLDILPFYQNVEREGIVLYG